MVKCIIFVDGFKVGIEEFTPDEIKGLNNEPGITVTAINN